MTRGPDIAAYMTPRERADYAVLWRQLAAAALTGDLEQLRVLARPALDWKSPTPARSDAWALFALPRLCMSFTNAQRDGVDRCTVAPLLKLGAMLALQVLDAFEEPAPVAPAEPARPPPRTYLPYKDD